MLPNSASRRWSLPPVGLVGKSIILFYLLGEGRADTLEMVAKEDTMGPWDGHACLRVFQI